MKAENKEQRLECCFREIVVNYKRPGKFSDLPKFSSLRDAYEYLRTIWSD
jgi:hypothetical protein